MKFWISVRLLALILIQVFLLIQLSDVSAKESDNVPTKKIFKHWVHSFEEDTKDVTVFRPSNYNFPPARGRGGFEIKEDKVFIQYRIGPTDRPEKVYGYWKAMGKNKIVVYFRNKETGSYSMNIISCTNDILKVKM